VSRIIYLRWLATGFVLAILLAGVAVWLNAASAESRWLKTLGGRRPAELEPPSGEALNGIDVLERQGFAPLKGLRLGLIVNQTGIDRQRHATIDLLREAPGVDLKALFSPEHGIRGDRDEQIGDGKDEKSGLPIFSLYGENRRPSPAQLAGLDALVFDIQDVGCRFYTYISTLNNTMAAASQAGLKFFVLDRPNPINGKSIEGPLLSGEPSFIACHPIPLRHGLTAGELAVMFQTELNLKLDLKIIPVQNWRRDMWFDQAGLPWINPSPNMRNLNEAALYPGVGLLEMTTVSVGRGTDTPFEIFGAPYIDDVKLAAEMNRARLPGVRFIPVRFTPKASVQKGAACGGVYIVITDRERLAAVDIGILAAQILHRWYPNDFKIDKVNDLLRHPATIEAIKSGRTLAEIKAQWNDDLRAFERRAKAFRRY
jgi:uncharacterized protein YbbC (DUF1343 family)